MRRFELFSRLKEPSEGRVVLLVLDGLGDLRTPEQPETALELATTPHLDALARRSSLGRLVPVLPGVTPGSGPGHLALFGYDPLSPEADIGRGVLEALGLGVELAAGDVAARGNFASADADGKITDRRAGRISTEECRRLAAALQEAVADFDDPRVEIEAGKGHRFVLVLHGNGLSSEIDDTDPQETGVAPLPLAARTPAGRGTVDRLEPVLARMREALADEPTANTFLLRGFSHLPHLPPLHELYGITPGAFAGYPLYRGVAGACGMEVVPCGSEPEEVIGAACENWDRFDFLFLHVKATDMAGEDGDVAAKAAAIERVDRALPALLAREPSVLAITGDHSTPAPMKGHSWHPVPLLLAAPTCFVDGCERFTEVAASRGSLGTLRSQDLMALLLAHDGRLKKFGA